MLIHAHSHIFHANTQWSQCITHRCTYYLVMELIMFNLTMPGAIRPGQCRVYSWHSTLWDGKDRACYIPCQRSWDIPPIRAHYKFHRIILRELRTRSIYGMSISLPWPSLVLQAAFSLQSRCSPPPSSLDVPNPPLCTSLVAVVQQSGIFARTVQK